MELLCWSLGGLCVSLAAALAASRRALADARAELSAEKVHADWLKRLMARHADRVNEIADGLEGRNPNKRSS